jgi:hypothetical protein
MSQIWTSLALALLLGSGLAGCHPARDDGATGGGGGGPSAVPSHELPESNDVNPSGRPDTYIDRRAEQKTERKQRAGH